MNKWSDIWQQKQKEGKKEHKPNKIQKKKMKQNKRLFFEQIFVL